MSRLSGVTISHSSTEAFQARAFAQVDSGLGAAGSLQHAAGLGQQGHCVSWPGQVGRIEVCVGKARTVAPRSPALMLVLVLVLVLVPRV